MSGKAPAPEILRELSEAVASRRYAYAQDLARQQLSVGVEHPKLLYLRAIWFQENGRLQDALADLQRGKILDPQDLAVGIALGDLFERLEARAEARDEFLRATTLRPDLSGPWLRLAWAYENLGEIEAARGAYERLLQITPTDPLALGRLAVIASQQGDWDEARLWAERSLQADPQEFSAALAYVRADVGDGRLETAETRVTRLLTQPLSPDNLYLAHKELGAIRHQQRRYEEAFDAWRIGNGVAHKHHAQKFGAHFGLAMAQTLWSYFSAQSPWERSSPVKSPAREHVFLLGFARSGTTLLEQVLAAHPDVVSLEEKETLGLAMQMFSCSQAGLDALRAADAEALAPAREAYWRAVASYGLEPAGKVFIDKSPFNATRLAHIARLFPQAKVLFAIRDPRDVVLSCFRTPLRVSPITYELLKIEEAGRYYATYMAAAEAITRCVPFAQLQLRHEELLDDLEEAVRRVCKFIGIDFRPSMLAFEAAERKVSTPSAHQLRQGLTRAGAGQWTHYARQMEPAMSALQPWIERFGYAP